MNNKIYYKKWKEDINNCISLISICVNKVKRKQTYALNTPNKFKTMKRHMKGINNRFKL